jgi:hypothetical protein
MDAHIASNMTMKKEAGKKMASTTTVSAMMRISSSQSAFERG